MRRPDARRSRRAATAAAAFATVAVLASSGCAWRSSADPQRGSGGGADGARSEQGSLLVRWPERYTTDLEIAAAGGATQLVSVVNVLSPQVGGPVRAEEIPIARVRSVRPYGQGVVRELVAEQPQVMGMDVSERGRARAARMSRLVPDAQFLSFHSPRQARGMLAERNVWRTSLSSTRLEYFAPVAPEGRPTPEPRGLVIHLGSMGGRPYEMPTLEQFRRRGWAVVRLNAATAWEPEDAVVIADAGDLGVPARRLASMIDDRIAEIAYAAEAAAAWVGETHPEIPRDRIVVVGYSAGALAAPATAVRLGERVRALVIVGAGANILDVSQSSSLTNGGIRINWPDGTRGSAGPGWNDLKTQYLDYTALDPYVLGPRLTDTPTLMLHGLLDEMVPAWTGDLAYERFGQPERWTFPLGHKGVFWRLPAYARDIAVWADEAAFTKPAPAQETVPE